MGTGSSIPPTGRAGSWGGGREGGVNLGGEELASLSSMGGEETLALPQCLRREV